MDCYSHFLHKKGSETLFGSDVTSAPTPPTPTESRPWNLLRASCCTDQNDVTKCLCERAHAIIRGVYQAKRACVCACVRLWMREIDTHTHRGFHLSTTEDFPRCCIAGLTKCFNHAKKKGQHVCAFQFVPYGVMWKEREREGEKKTSSKVYKHQSVAKAPAVANFLVWLKPVIGNRYTCIPRGLRLWLAAEVQRSRNSGSNEIKLKSKLKKEKKME